MKNPAPKSARGSDESWKILHGSLAVFNVEQVALNRHEQYFKDNVRELSHTHSSPVNPATKKHITHKKIFMALQVLTAFRR
jgi:hypothetical protein